MSGWNESWLADYQQRLRATPATPTGVIHLTLALPPSTNKIWRPGTATTKDGKSYAALFKRKPYKEWRAIAEAAVGRQRGGQHIERHFGMRITLGKTRTDPDACIKPVLDACQHGGAIGNDKYLRLFQLDVQDGHPSDTVAVSLWPVVPT
jgi:Holliday junction resolvase RusA-like endonuclease